MTARPRSPYCRNVIAGERCGKLEHDHVDGKCPRDLTRKFSLFTSSPTRASGSFSEAELDWLAEMIRVGLRGGDARVLMRRPECSTALKHINSMRAVIERQKKDRQERLAAKEPAP